jgi:hypothetical protein
MLTREDVADTYRKSSAALQAEIFAKQYYTERYNAALRHHGMNVEGVTAYQYAPQTLQDMWNTFWFALPDGPQIRTDTFFRVCDLCEEDLRFG